jgi:hypothetical protein
LFEKEIESAKRYYERAIVECTQAAALVAAAGLSDLAPLTTRVWLYAPTSTGQDETAHPDWPCWTDAHRGVVDVNLYIPFEHKAQAREIALQKGLEWHKSYHLDHASGRRSATYFVEEWIWLSDPEKGLYNCDQIELHFYRPVVEGEIINGCKITSHVRESIFKELVLSCKTEESAR